MNRALIIAVAMTCAVACDRRGSKAMDVVRGEFSLLQPPGGIAPQDQQVGLGEMYAEGVQTYCVKDGNAGRPALDSMLRNAGWEPVSSSTTAGETLWHYRKGQHLGSLRLDAQPQPCGRRFQVEIQEPL